MFKRLSRTLVTLVVAAIAATAPALPRLDGLPQVSDANARKFQPTFAITTDSCFPYPAIGLDGRVNGGLATRGSQTGEGRRLQQLEEASTYFRHASYPKAGVNYEVRMYALYFPKDQVVPNTHSYGGFLWGAECPWGHRHDWEFVLVWTRNGQLTHASFSQHGKPLTVPKDQLVFAADRPNSVLAFYFKDERYGFHALTRSMRPARPGETAPAPGWIRPDLFPVDPAWNQTRWVEAVRIQLNRHDFGKAVCPVSDGRFQDYISRNPPPGYPTAAEWRSVQKDAKPRDYSVAPPTPPGLVARWRVFQDREAPRDNRRVNLPAHRTARIVVHLPSGPREKFLFTLKHDKSWRSDKSRTPLIGHGSIVRGDSHDWASFGQRIYLGERKNSGEVWPWQSFSIAYSPFYVDLVLND